MGCGEGPKLFAFWAPNFSQFSFAEADRNLVDLLQEIAMPAPTIEDAIDALRKLPPERQAELASYIFDLATDEREPEEISPADLPSVLEGLEQAKRRQFASTERVAEVLGRLTK